MNYTNEQIRRQDRLLEKEKAISLLKNGEYGVLSMQDEENGAYGVPINYVWNKKNSIYIHCAPKDENYIVSNTATPFLSVL